LIVGGGFGLLAIKDKSDLDKQCKNNICPPGYQDRLDSANTAGTISTIVFAVAGAGLVLGTVLFFTASPTSTANVDGSKVAANSPARAGGILVRPRGWVGLGQAGFAADF
jgi:hypothetical protein